MFYVIVVLHCTVYAQLFIENIALRTVHYFKLGNCSSATRTSAIRLCPPWYLHRVYHGRQRILGNLKLLLLPFGVMQNRESNCN